MTDNVYHWPIYKTAVTLVQKSAYKVFLVTVSGQ